MLSKNLQTYYILIKHNLAIKIRRYLPDRASPRYAHRLLSMSHFTVLFLITGLILTFLSILFILKLISPLDSLSLIAVMLRHMWNPSDDGGRILRWLIIVIPAYCSAVISGMIIKDFGNRRLPSIYATAHDNLVEELLNDNPAAVLLQLGNQISEQTRIPLFAAPDSITLPLERLVKLTGATAVHQMLSAPRTQQFATMLELHCGKNNYLNKVPAVLLLHIFGFVHGLNNYPRDLQNADKWGFGYAFQNVFNRFFTNLHTHRNAFGNVPVLTWIREQKNALVRQSLAARPLVLDHTAKQRDGAGSADIDLESKCRETRKLR